MIRSQSSRAAALFVGPPLAFLAAITLYPLIFSLWISLRDYSLMRPSASTFVGLKNYLAAFTTSGPRSSLLRSLYFAACSIGVELVLALVVALVLNQSFPGRNVVRAFLVLTWALPDIVNSVLWKWIYNGDLGALNGLLYQLGIIERYRAWLSDPRLALNLLIASNIWRCAPFVAIILLAGLQSIPDELYEVSRVDGASFAKQFRYFIFPMLRPTILVILVLRSMDALRVFGLVYIVTNGGPGDSTKTIGFYIFQEAFKSLQLGSASALSWVLLIIVMVLAALYLRFIRASR
jgi:multiple sugar transport system permease protein